MVVASDMNYTIVINGFVWVGCMSYYFLFAQRWYTGPRMTVDEARFADSDTIAYNTESSAGMTIANGKEE